MSTQSADGTGKSPVVAALLGILYPGLGHVYLRRWGRALMWSWLFITTLILLIPEAVMPTALSLEAIVAAVESAVSLEAVRRAPATVPLYVAALMLLISTMSVVDAYWIAAQATREEQASDDEPTVQSCPSCGKELDEDLDFCHWCTTELNPDEE